MRITELQNSRNDDRNYRPTRGVEAIAIVGVVGAFVIFLSGLHVVELLVEDK